MATIQVDDYWEQKVFVNHAKGGFSESYKFPGASPTAAKATAALIAGARADILSLSFSIAHSSLSKKSVKGDSWKPDPYRSQPTVLAVGTDVGGVVNPCNDAEVGPLWRFDDGNGKFVNRVIRGLRDSQITNNSAIYQTAAADTLAAVLANAAPTPTVTTHNAVLKMYLSTVFHLTRLYSKLSKTVANKYDEIDFATTGTISYRRVSSHDVGQRYGVSRGRQAAWA